jgi:hypothetical protein
MVESALLELTDYGAAEPMSIRLIVNSDDYGRTREVSRGIREAHLRGIVTSSTCMMNMPTVVEDIQLAMQETPRLGLGVHLVLTSGRPLLPADQLPGLTTADGSFLKQEQLLERLEKIDPAHARRNGRRRSRSSWRRPAERPPTWIRTTIHRTSPRRYFATCWNWRRNTGLPFAG